MNLIHAYVHFTKKSHNNILFVPFFCVLDSFENLQDKKMVLIINLRSTMKE